MDHHGDGHWHAGCPPPPATISTAVMRTKVPRGIDRTGAPVGWGDGLWWRGRWWLGIGGRLRTGGTRGFMGETGKRLGVSGASGLSRLAYGYRLATGGGIAWPEPIEEEEHPHERDQHQLGEHELGSHGKVPSSSDEMRVLYRVFGLHELSAGWRDTTTRRGIELDASRRAAAVCASHGGNLLNARRGDAHATAPPHSSD
jgi:hypothetical protein